MGKQIQLPESPAGRQARLNYLISIGFGGLDESLQAEVAALVAADVDDWRREVGSRLIADITAGAPRSVEPKTKAEGTP